MKKLSSLSVKMTKVSMILLVFVIFIAIAGLTESMVNGQWLGVIVSALVLYGSITLIVKIVKTKNFKTIEDLEGPGSLGEEITD
ncbi:hypothetical protein GW758_03875 [Candidatus Falkowbacteria bacterium]|nr:hypothetical protein [Candidatus Falkowbacteria bacterium]